MKFGKLKCIKLEFENWKLEYRKLEYGKLEDIKLEDINLGYKKWKVRVCKVKQRKAQVQGL